MNRDAPRYSGDIGVFHDREERVASAAASDAQTLEAAGYGVRWLRRLPAIYTAEIIRQDDATRLERVVDSDFRFFRPCGMTPSVMSCTRLTLPRTKFHRNPNYPAAEWRALVSTEPIDPSVTVAKLRNALNGAEAFVSRMPADKAGMLFFSPLKLFSPTPTAWTASNSYRTNTPPLAEQS